MGRHLLVHIGLPKTATTTLQSQVFPALDTRDGFIYAGVFQPRGSKESDLFRSFTSAVLNGDQSDFKNAISGTPEDCRIVFSEEMVTVGSSRRSWEDNLCRLKDLLEPYDYSILVTLRNPLDAIPSYYVELYESMMERWPVFKAALVEDPRMGIFLYSSFIPFLRDLFGSECINFCRFEDIVSGDLANVGQFLGGEMPEGLHLPDMNKKTKKGRAVRFQGKSKVKLSDFLLDKLDHSPEGKLMTRIYAFLIFVGLPVLSRIRVRRFYTVPLPDAKELEKLRDLIDRDVLFYESI